MTIGNRPPTVRADGRGPNDLRPVSFTLGVQKWAEGSCRIKVGDTEVLCAATIVDRVPPHLRGKGTGWVTAEYSMLPRATAERTDRESVKGRIGGRTHEIQRLIGRSLRGVVDLARLGERTITVDCDVLQADGGTRTASITGGYVALAAALITYGMERHLVAKVAAVSVGLVNGLPYLDLDYSEDSRADVDFNVVGTDAGAYVELQGTAEGKPFDRAASDTAARPRRRRPGAPVRGAVGGPGHRPSVTRRRLLVATRSPHKLRELRELLALEHADLVSLDEARRRRASRSRTARRSRRTPRSRPASACAPAACRPSPTTPGSRSTRSTAARASGRDGTPARTPPTRTTTRKLLAALDGLPPERRGARYVCVLAVALPDRVGAARRGRARDRPRDLPRADRDGAARDGRVRLRPHLRAGLGAARRPDPGPVDAGREARHLASGAGGPADGAAAGGARVLSARTPRGRSLGRRRRLGSCGRRRLGRLGRLRRRPRRRAACRARRTGPRPSPGSAAGRAPASRRSGVDVGWTSGERMTTLVTSVLPTSSMIAASAGQAIDRHVRADRLADRA